MKKVFLGLFFCLAIVFVGKSQLFTIDDFRVSRSATLLSTNSFMEGKIIDYDLSTIVTEEVNGNSVSVIHLYVKNGEGLNIGRILAIKKTSSRFLPEGHDYAVAYGDFTEVDNNENGVLKVYDLNWGNYLAASFTLAEGQVSEWSANHIPDNIREMYGRPVSSSSHFCDANHNGDVSWGECFVCLHNACQQDPECKKLCDFADKYGNPKGQCHISMAASCVWIAAFN